MLRALILLSIFFPVSTFAQGAKCPKGTQSYADHCITQGVADYIACVEASGGNRSEIVEVISTLEGLKTKTGGKISASGPVLKGSVSGVLDKDSEKTLVRTLETKWYANGMSECTKYINHNMLKRVKKDIEDLKKKSKEEVKHREEVSRKVVELKTDSVKEKKSIKAFEADVNITFSCFGGKCPETLGIGTPTPMLLLMLKSRINKSVPKIDFYSDKSYMFKMEKVNDENSTYKTILKVNYDAFPMGLQINELYPYDSVTVNIPFWVDDKDMPKSILVKKIAIDFKINGVKFPTAWEPTPPFSPPITGHGTSFDYGWTDFKHEFSNSLVIYNK